MKKFWLMLPLGTALLAQDAAPAQKKKMSRPPRPGVKEAQKPMDTLKPEAVFSVPGVPDWTTAAPDGIWVSNKPKGTISKLDARTNTVTATVEVGDDPDGAVKLVNWSFGDGSHAQAPAGQRPQLLEQEGRGDDGRARVESEAVLPVHVGAAARRIELLEHRDLVAPRAESHRGGQAAEATADHDGVAGGTHRLALATMWRTRRTPR